MADYDIQAARLNASGAIHAGRCRIRGVSWVGGAAAGTLTVKDGGVGGVTRLILDTPLGATLSGYQIFPGRGILCRTDGYLVISSVGFVTVFFEGL